MQREEKIGLDSIIKVIDALYDGNPAVFEAYSAFDKDIRDFPTKESLNDFLFERAKGKSRSKLVYCFVQYPGTGGYVRKVRKHLDPKKCEGATVRYTCEGWGLIQFQLDMTDQEFAVCRVAVNSEKRAIKWADVYPELRSPDLWNWGLIEKNMRRLIRVLRKNSYEK